LDRYDTTLVLKIYTAAWVPWLKGLTDLIFRRLPPERIVLRLSRNIGPSTAERFGKQDGQILRGHDVCGPVPFLETGLHFEADVVRGQKTGFFLDQRENRRRIEGLARGRTLLNAFSFSGGFSVYAARGGATTVTDLDISPHALAAAERNFFLNQTEPSVQACRTERIQAEAFEWLAANPRRRFGLVVLDPPSMARRESERAGALAAYFKLCALGIGHLERGGVLLACSCSAHVSEAEFFEVVRKAALNSRRSFAEIGRATEPPDHPGVFPEMRYLKAIYLRFDGRD
jgi:23S rRNA (cytosine1962-C5)-methyltransferase